jgi:hypothetical protein
VCVCVYESVCVRSVFMCVCVYESVCVRSVFVCVTCYLNLQNLYLSHCIPIDSSRAPVTRHLSHRSQSWLPSAHRPCWSLRVIFTR